MTTRDKHPGPLLIVDDWPSVLLALERHLRLYVSTVIGVTSPPEAEAALRDKGPVMLLCDYWLGAEHPPATELIPRWRRQHPSLRKVALMTGTKSSAFEGAQGVDAVFQKPLEIDAVRDFLLAGE